MTDRNVEAVNDHLEEIRRLGILHAAHLQSLARKEHKIIFESLLRPWPATNSPQNPPQTSPEPPKEP